MEGNLIPPPTAASDTVSDRRLIVTLDECPAWTNKNHNSYLYHLEMSFVEQLYQSKSVVARCSVHNLRGINQFINVSNASYQYDVLHNRCWQKSRCAAGEHIHGSTSRHSEHGGVHCHPSLSKVPISLKLVRTWKQGEGVISHGTRTCSEDIIDFGREGTGQNFLDEDNQNTLNSESQASFRGWITSGSNCAFKGMASSRLHIINQRISHYESVLKL